MYPCEPRRGLPTQAGNPTSSHDCGSPRRSVATTLLAKTTICVRPIVRLCLPAQTGESQRSNPRFPESPRPARADKSFFNYVTIKLRHKTCIFIQICYSFATMVIRMRHTRSHTANRRSHHGLKSPEMAVCKNCGGHHRPHHMCLNCGFYNGKMVLDLVAKKKDREERMATKREAISANRADTTKPVATTPNK